MENVILSEICKKCAECCRNYPFIELSKSEVNLLEQVTGLKFDVFTNLKGKSVEEYFLQFQENGDCLFLNENNASYFCSVYKARPETCINYPSNIRQKEVCDANRKKGMNKYFG